MTTTPWRNAICFALISSLITFPSANQYLCAMFSLLRGLTPESPGKQCACSMRSNNNLYAYTFSFELLLNF